jgi:hypothetical protein
MDTLIETDARGRVTLPGMANRRFLMRETEHGTVVLEPAVVMSQAQYDYDTDPELQAMLHEAMTGPHQSHPRRKRRLT